MGQVEFEQATIGSLRDDINAILEVKKWIHKKIEFSSTLDTSSPFAAMQMLINEKFNSVAISWLEEMREKGQVPHAVESQVAMQVRTEDAELANVALEYLGK